MTKVTIYGNIYRVAFVVEIKKKELKKLRKIPERVQKKLKLLVLDLEAKGPVLPEWPNYSKLTANKYHCHLTYSYVACWKNEEGKVVIEVYYAGELGVNGA
ncbi:hypothetical protein ACFL5V_08875 [Fibrobacterota bacterium]